MGFIEINESSKIYKDLVNDCKEENEKDELINSKEFPEVKKVEEKEKENQNEEKNKSKNLEKIISDLDENRQPELSTSINLRLQEKELSKKDSINEKIEDFLFEDYPE